MGLTNSKGGGTFLRFKEGKFFRNSDKETLYDSLDGTITSFNFAEDEINGSPVRKLVIRLTDGDENFILGIPFDNSISTSLISFLKNADLTKPLSLVGTFKEDKEGKKRSGILVAQDGVFMKSFYSKANPNGLPEMKKLTINKKIVWDKTEMQEFLENVVLNELNKIVSHNEAANVTTNIDKKVEEGDDDLPF